MMEEQAALIAVARKVKRRIMKLLKPKRSRLESASPRDSGAPLAPSYDVLLVVARADGAPDEGSWLPMRDAVHEALGRAGVRCRGTGRGAHPASRLDGRSLGAPSLVLCLGPAPDDFRKPAGVPMIQLLGASPETPWSERSMNRDSDVLCCFSADVFGQMQERYPRKEVRRLSLDPVAVAEELCRYATALGLGKDASPMPLRAFRGDGKRLIDVYMTTSLRAGFFRRTFEALLRASEATRHEIRLNVFVDRLDRETLRVIEPHLDRVGLLSTNFQLGLPFLYNMVLEHQEQVDTRSENFADYICYIQDDCLIANEQVYFDFMVASYEELLPVGEIGYVSGFYCPIHPGFEIAEFRDKKLLLSDSIDGKNFMAPPALLRSVGPLSWFFPDGERRGNPGPTRGSHFDLWQWKESPRSLMKQKRVSVVIPGLCIHLAQSAEESTWGNETSSSKQLERREAGRVYKTRGTLPPVVENEF